VEAGRLVTPATILIRNGVIVSLHPSPAETLGAREINLPRAYLMPGMIDAHTHLDLRLGPDLLLRDLPVPVELNPRITIIYAAVHEDGRPAPGLSIVVGTNQFDAAEGADVRFTAPRVDQKQAAVAAADHSGPAVVQVGLVADDLSLTHASQGGCMSTLVAAKNCADKSTTLQEHLATVHPTFHLRPPLFVWWLLSVHDRWHKCYQLF